MFAAPVFFVLRFKILPPEFVVFFDECKIRFTFEVASV